MWVPGDPWPGTPGGAHGGPNYPWGTPIRLYVRAGLAAGRAWTIGPHVAARLDGGNVIGPVAADADPPTIDGRLWVDVSCDTTAVTINDGSTTAAGIFSRDEAATLTLDLVDPARTYDPLNANGPYWYQGTTRLTAGVPVEVFAEVVEPASSTITRYTLFKGTADRWTHELEPVAMERRTRVVATGAVKALANTNYEETTSVGAGDTVAQRIARLVAYYGWTGGVERVGVESTATLAATTLAQSAWELFNRTIDDELGFVHVTPDGVLRWLTRNAWYETSAPAITLGCDEAVAPGAYDIVTDLRMGSVDEQLRNAVYASRSGGVMQVVKSLPSIQKHGGYETALRRTDLGLADDTQVATWAGTVIMLYAYPLSAPDALSLLPARVIDATGAIWRAVLGCDIASDLVRVVWQPSDPTAPLDQTVRVVGKRHEITANGWSVDWQVVPAGLATAKVWRIGPHANAKLDDGNVVGFRKSA